MFKSLWQMSGTQYITTGHTNAGFRQSNFGGKDFLIVYEQVIVHAYPADIAAIIDENPEILSVIDFEMEYPRLFTVW